MARSVLISSEEHTVGEVGPDAWPDKQYTSLSIVIAGDIVYDGAQL